jgi:hypothetical protein
VRKTGQVGSSHRRRTHLHRPAGKRNGERDERVVGGGFRGGCEPDEQAAIVPPAGGSVHHEEGARVGELMRGEQSVLEAGDQVSSVALHELGQVAIVLHGAVEGELALHLGQAVGQ